jgi:hypothetical protein
MTLRNVRDLECHKGAATDAEVLFLGFAWPQIRLLLKRQITLDRLVLEGSVMGKEMAVKRRASICRADILIRYPRTGL